MNYLIPNFVVQSINDDVSLINKMFLDGVISDTDNDKVLLIFIYLFRNTTQSNTVNFTLEDMIAECGFYPKANKGGINDKFKLILDHLNSSGYFTDNDIDFLAIKPKQFVKVRMSYFNVDGGGNKINYFILTDEEIQSIYNITEVDNKKLLLYFATLKSRVYNAKYETDNKAQTTYTTVEDMCEDVLLYDNTGHIYNDILADNDIIYYDNAGKFVKVDKSNRVYRQSANTYTLTSIENYKNEVEKSIDSYTNYMSGFGWKLCKDTEMSNRQIAGTLSKLTFMEKNGELSEQNKIKLEKARQLQNMISDTKKFDNKELLEKNHGQLLSDIFFNVEMDSLGEKYQDIECSLGLVDKDNNLLVEWDYYSWVITEYNIKEHDKYKNYVTKKIKESKVIIDTTIDLETGEILEGSLPSGIRIISDEEYLEDKNFEMDMYDELYRDNPF